MALSPTPFCSHCNVNSSSFKLSLCQACKIVHYCGLVHQLADKEHHLKVCNAIQKGQRVLDGEEKKLRLYPGDFMTPPNLFEGQAGRFGDRFETQDYMIARYALVETLLKVKTYAAVEAAHGHCIDMLRLCRSDYMGVRDKVPALKLRLGRDQECYDFCKWWAITENEDNYDWKKMSDTDFDVKNADVFEGPQKLFIKKSGGLNHLVAITLLKIKLLITVRALQNSSVIGEKLPQEILDSVRDQIVSGSALAGNKTIVYAQDQTIPIMDLEIQVDDLYEAVERINEHFWRALLNPNERTVSRSFEKQTALQQNCDAWIETPGAIDMIRELTLPFPVELTHRKPRWASCSALGTPAGPASGNRIRVTR